MAGTELPPHVLRVPRWTFIIHGAQIVLAIVILGLDAYGIRWIAYNALIYSLVTCLCTLGVCVYLLASQLFVHQFYNMYIALVAHLWMILFWIIDLGLVANLARIWAGPRCSYSCGTYACYYSCSYKRDLHTLYKREEETTTQAYYGALAAGAVFAAAQFGLWILSAIILAIHLNKHRTAATNTTVVHPQQPQQLQQVPPQYAPNNGQAVPLEKYNQTGVPASAHQTPQPHYVQPVQPPQQQFMAPYGQDPTQPPQQQFTAPYAQDPVPRQDTVSPISQVGYGYAPPPNVPELSTPQHTGNPYPANVSELSSPQHTGNPYPANVSELSSPQHTGRQNPDVPELSNHR